MKDIEGSLGDGKKIEYPIIADADRSIAQQWGGSSGWGACLFLIQFQHC